MAHPAWRASSVGVYRLWRDGGYVVGALLAGVLADVLGLVWAIGAIGSLTALSGVAAALVMRETLPEPPLAVEHASEDGPAMDETAGEPAAGTKPGSCTSTAVPDA